MSLLVVICTHQPRRDHLDATLAALRAQTLPAAQWDLLIVDNASPDPLAAWLDLAWHPTARVSREDRLGTAHARHHALRSAGESQLVLFVDDDNVLAPDYLAQGLALAAAWPQLGCWGGQLLPRYEGPAPDWIGPYLKYLAVLPLTVDRWTNFADSYDSVPPSAGCFIRPVVVRRYLALIAADPRRLELGARGAVPVRGEDTDLVLTALDLDLGVGRFTRLRLTHLIPPDRLTVDYVTRLIEGTVFGTGLLEYLRHGRSPRPAPSGRLTRALLCWRTWRLPEPRRALRHAELRGRAAARMAVQVWRREETSAAAAPLSS
jgi:GT2 family glycosyltransferase